MENLKNKFIFSILIFLAVVMIACSGSKNAADQKRYESNMNDMIVAVNNAISDAGLNMKGSINREDGSILITAVEYTNSYGSEEPVQTMSIDIVLDKIDDKTVMVEIESPTRKRYVMAGNSQTAGNKFRERIFNSLEKTIGSINTEG